LCFVWGTVKFAKCIAVVSNSSGWIVSETVLSTDLSELNTLTFGQMVAVILLASPIFSMAWKFSDGAALHKPVKSDTETQRPGNPGSCAALQDCNAYNTPGIDEESLPRRQFTAIDDELLSEHGSQYTPQNESTTNKPASYTNFLNPRLLCHCSVAMAGYYKCICLDSRCIRTYVYLR
jgi:hypothetical protein